MLFLLQLAIGVAFLGYLILAFFDAVRGICTILSGLALLAFGYTLKAADFALKKIHPASVPVVAPARTAKPWRVIP